MTPEDEAFDEIARKQGHWGGGFMAKRAMAADKLQEPDREALALAIEGLEKILHTFAKDGKVVMSSMIRNELFAEVNSLLQQTKASLAQPAQEPVAMYGYCPMCGAKGVSRERRLNGNDLCASGHIYPSRDSTAPPKREWIWLSDADIRETIDSICQYNGDYDEWLCKKIETKIKELNT